MAHEWFIRRGAREEGPHAPAALKRLAREGKLVADDDVRRDDRPDWVKASKIRGLFDSPSSLTPDDEPPSSVVPAAPSPPVTPKPAAPPPLPAAAPAAPTPKVDGAAAVAELSRNRFDYLSVVDPSILRGESLTPKKREGIASYAGLRGGESILFAVDSTIFGVATEGITLTDQAIAWAFPDGNRGRVQYDAILAQSVHVDARPGNPQRLCFVSGDSQNQVLCKSLKQPSAAALAEFLTAAVRIAQGLRPDDALPRARDLAESGQGPAAVALWKAVLEDDILQFPSILDDVARLCEKRSGDPALKAYHDSMSARAADRDTGWLSPRVGGPPEELAAPELEDRWRNGTLRRESRLRHLSDRNWTTAGQEPWCQRMRTVYVSDTGTFDEEQFTACVRALAAEGLDYDSMLVFGPTSAKVDDAAGKPILHIGLTGEELILAWRPAEGDPVIERSPAIGVVWKYSELHGARQVELATAKRSATFILPAGSGSGHLVRVASEGFLQAAEASAAKDRRTEASRLLDRVVSTDATREQIDRLRERVRADEEVLCVYDGGHPDHVDACLGTLRLDGDGFEFMSIAPESQVCFRVPYERVVDFAAPQRGAMPAELQKSLLGPNSLLSAGLGVAAACVIPGGAMLVRSLSGSLAGDRTAGPPLNRLTAVTSLSGTPYKIYFDVVGESVADMSQKAKTFWSRTARMKSRFLKPGAAAATARPADAADPEVKALLREIRDSLQMVLRVLSLDMVTARRREPGLLAMAQLEALRNTLGKQLAGTLGLPMDGASPETRSIAIVIACPKCQAKIRAANPGVIKCPSCGTLARLGPNLFASRSVESAPLAATDGG